MRYIDILEDNNYFLTEEERAEQGLLFLRQAPVPTLKAYRDCKKLLGWKPLPLKVYVEYLKHGEKAVLRWKMREAIKAHNARVRRSITGDR